MRSSRPSQTSSLVALLRALADAGLTEVSGFKDATALPLLPPLWRVAFEYLRWRGRKDAFRQRLLGEKSSGAFDVVALRTRVLDEAWHAAHALKTRQLVLLGAGLDGRAFRLQDVRDSAVFEVDHPFTQRQKRERARALSFLAQRHVYVPVNFETDSLEEALKAAGQASDVPTFWIWEGVTPYLTHKAQEATLSAIARRSAPGSRLAMTYTEPTKPGTASATVRRTAKMVRWFGEPFLGLLRQKEASALLGASGFRLLEDTGPEAWRKRYARRPEGPAGPLLQRIAVAEVVHGVAHAAADSVAAAVTPEGAL
jgi:methyltransferase (TIGR00027 family)